MGMTLKKSTQWVRQYVCYDFLDKMLLSGIHSFQEIAFYQKIVWQFSILYAAAQITTQI